MFHRTSKSMVIIVLSRTSEELSCGETHTISTEAKALRESELSCINRHMACYYSALE